MRLSLADALFWAAAACCLVAQLAIFRSTAVTRSAAAGTTVERRKSAADVVWVVLPSIALAGVLWFTWRAMHPGS